MPSMLITLASTAIVAVASVRCGFVLLVWMFVAKESRRWKFRSKSRKCLAVACESEMCASKVTIPEVQDTGQLAKSSFRIMVSYTGGEGSLIIYTQE